MGGALRLEDGRAMRVVFPGVPGPGAGPDFREAMIELDGDLVRGEVELHLRASGWFAHGHHRDPAFARVILHVVAANDSGFMAMPVAGRVPMPILVLPPGEPGDVGDVFTPPCVFRRDGAEVPAILERMGERRLRMKAARLGPVQAEDAGAYLYGALLEVLAGPSNRAAFASLARVLPLGLLLERVADLAGDERERGVLAELRYAAAGVLLRRAGMRPLASPMRRLELAARAIHALWPPGPASWPEPLAAGESLLPALRAAGLSRALAIETAVNAVLPLLLASGRADEQAVLAAWHSLPAPGTYGKLKRLQGWLSGESRPFTSASRLQGGLLLHAEYCARGKCGRCPVSC